MIKASVIIPNFNGKYLLEECLNSLKNQTFKNFEIILVDNNSSDGSIEYIRQNFKAVKVISLNKNYGFAFAINRGVESSKVKYVVFLNNDTKVDKNWIKNLIKTAKKYPNAFAVNSKLLNYYNPKLIDGIGLQVNEVGQSNAIGWGEQDTGQYDDQVYIFGATGGASLFKRKEFIDIGMFDEDYFMYCEDLDLSLRAQFLGYKSVFCPSAIVYHKHKATSSKRPQFVEYWEFKNMTQTIIKDFPTSLLFKNLRLLKIILVHFNTIFYQLKNGFFWPPLLTEIWLIFNLPKLIVKRWKIQSTKKVSDEYIESFLTPKRISFWGFRK